MFLCGYILVGFGTVVNALGERMKAYLPQVCGTIKWRLNNKSAKVRMQAADLISRIAVVLKTCNEDQLMGHLGVVLYEYLGEEVNPLPCYCFSQLQYTWYVCVCVLLVPRGAGQHPRRPEGDCERDRHDQDDPAHQGPAAAPHADPQEQAREGAGELYRPRGSNRRQRRRAGESESP